jgi:branched-chain amino acid transport system substrate-binding protein
MKKRSKKHLVGGMERRTFLKIVGAGTIGFALGGGIPSRALAAKEILIGDIHPTTGGSAEFGKACQDGTQLAVEQINAAGGIKSLGGAKLKLLLANSEGKPEVGMRAAEKMIQEGVVAMIGAFQSSVTFVTTQIGEKYQIPTVCEFGIADEILTRGFKYVFRIMPSTDMASEQWATFTKDMAKSKNIEVKTVVIIHENSLFGTSFAKKAKGYIEKAGMELMAVIPYPSNTADLSSEVSKIKALGPDVIAPISYTSDAILMTKALASQKAYAKFYVGLSSAGHISLGYVQSLGKLAEYNMTQAAYGNLNSPKFSSFVSAYQKRFGGPPNIAPVVYNYSAALILADAIERASSADPKAIRDALAKSNFKDHLLCGEAISFDEVGQNKIVVSPFMQVFKGEYLVVWPKKYAQREPVIPMPSWDEILSR